MFKKFSISLPLDIDQSYELVRKSGDEIVSWGGEQRQSRRPLPGMETELLVLSRNNPDSGDAGGCRREQNVGHGNDPQAAPGI